VGHAGTLDPLAEGVLVLGVGPAVRLVPYVQQMPKHYQATFRLGESSLSGDLEGEIRAHPDLPVPTLSQLQSAATQLTGHIRQTPPAHSAIWVDGKRAYQRVRAGEQVNVPSRSVNIERLTVTAYQFPDVQLDVVCGSGTYIRTLGIDLAKLAGSCAVMSYLKRAGIGPFDCRDSVTITQLREQPIESMLVPATGGIGHLPRTIVDADQSVRLGHGLTLGEELELEAAATSDRPIDGVEEAAAITAEGRLRAIIRRKRGLWCPYRVFPLD
jgi:tRNA pseudouridine55 synthase